MKPMKSLIAASLLVVLAACAPAAQQGGGGVEVALINAPADDRVFGIAEALQAEVESVPNCCGFAFIRSQPIRFQETHRDLFGSRAAPQSASLARNLGAELAVMASAPRFERSVEDVDGGREVRGVVQLRAVVLDSETGESLGTVGSLTFRGDRFLPENEPLPEIEEDPTMLELIDDAAEDLAPHLAALLMDVAPEYRAAAR